jgi:hypothetical protein
MLSIFTQRPQNRYAIGTLLLVSAILSVFVAWIMLRPALNIAITMMPCSAARYDDLAGHHPLCAVVQVTNMSQHTVWFLGYPGAAEHIDQQRVNGVWTSSISAVFLNGAEKASSPWTALRSYESIVILAGPISEDATEIRVGVPFTTERFMPSTAHWIFGPIADIVKRGDTCFPEIKGSAEQEEQIHPLAWLGTQSIDEAFAPGRRKGG